MLSASVDTRALSGSLKEWQAKFGDSNEEAIVRVGMMTARELAKRMQPWGTGEKAKAMLEDAIAKDVRKSLRVVPDQYFWQLLSGKRRSARWRGEWLSITPDMLLKSSRDVLKHVDSLRSRRTGKVDKRKVTRKSVKVTSKTILTFAIQDKARRAGLSKGLWLVAGQKLTRFIPRKKGLAIRLSQWPGSVGNTLPRLASAKFARGTFAPSVEIENKTPQTRLERFLKERDVAKIAKAAWRRTERQYKRAVERIDRERGAR